MHSCPFCTTISVYLLGSRFRCFTQHAENCTFIQARCVSVKSDLMSSGMMLERFKVSRKCWCVTLFVLSLERPSAMWKHPRGTPLQYANKHPNTVIIALHFLLTITASLLCAVWWQLGASFYCPHWLSQQRGQHRLCMLSSVVMEIQERDSLILWPSSGNWLQRFPASLHHNTV